MELLLPIDYVVADRFEGGEGSAKVVPLDQIPDGWLGLDHGPESTAAIRSALQGCRTVLTLTLTLSLSLPLSLTLQDRAVERPHGRLRAAGLRQG